MNWDNLAIVDVETTGGRPPHDRVIEIGVVAVDCGRVSGTYSQLINPECWLPPEITGLTGITPEQLEDQPTFPQVIHRLFPWLQDRVMVAHNVRFDLSFLKSEFTRLGYTYNPKYWCSVRLSRRLFPQYKSHALDRLIERHEIKVENRHRALDDALVIWEFLQKLTPIRAEDEVKRALGYVAKTPTLPPQLSIKVMEKLPSAPGVYIFWGEETLPLYIGKSINVKERVLAHFYSDMESGRERAIKEQVKRIEVIEAAGDLEAQLTESRLVKELLPVYNRKLRVTRELVGLALKIDGDNYLRAELNRIEQMPMNWSELYGLYKSRQQAEVVLKEVVEKQGLCWKLMGLEATKKACFGYHLGQCKGACIGREPAARYNLRVLKALGGRKLMDWPFAGKVVIEEASEVNGRRAAMVFENWQYIGAYDIQDDFTPGELAAVSRSTPGEKSAGGKVGPGLDLDTYKILKRYLQQHPNRARLVGRMNYA